ncbi:MAG: hypothetical protein A2Y18_01670 [Clostridiales bacterium GWD2_32_19]|nr:MAG: hypothetical protein A2Y18_01670 [Clostridiales bacterium GWD2_32_19]
MTYIEAIDNNEKEEDKRLKLFLAGGITNCSDWQKELANKLMDLDIIVYNPRREKYPSGLEEVEKQIRWEYEKLKKSDIISVWFAHETIQPITLYELGKWVNSHIKDKHFFIGIDPEYERKIDVEIQTKLALEDNGIFDFVFYENIDDLAKAVRAYVDEIER